MGGGGGRGGMGLLARVVPALNAFECTGGDEKEAEDWRPDFFEESPLTRDCNLSPEFPMDNFDIIRCKRPDPRDLLLSSETALTLT